VKATAAERFTMLADMLDLARKGFITTEGQLVTAINDVPTQPHPRSV
jgi:hypothetical protein